MKAMVSNQSKKPSDHVLIKSLISMLQGCLDETTRNSIISHNSDNRKLIADNNIFDLKASHLRDSMDRAI